MRKNLRQAASALVVAAMVLALASPVVAAPRAEPAGPASLASLSTFGELFAWVEQWLQPLGPERVAAASGRGMALDGAPANTDSLEAPDGPVSPQSHGTMDPDG